MLKEQPPETMDEQTPEERIHTKIMLTRFVHAIEHFRTLADDLPLQTAQVLTAITLWPGITTQELMKRVKLSQSSCSRNVTRLSHTDRHGKPGLGVVEARIDPTEPRRHVMYLTPKGEEFMAVLADILR